MNETTDSTTINPDAKRLERVRDGRLLTGTAAGIGRYLGIDANLVRVGFVVIALLGGAGFLAYVAAAVLLPGEGGEPPLIRRLRLPWRSGTGRAVLGATLLVIAATAILGTSDAIAWDTAAGIGLIGLGVVLAVAAFVGGARWLIAPALLLAAVAGFLKAADVHLHGGWGDRDVTVAAIADLHDRYDISAGRLRIDLRDLQIDAGQERTVHARVGFGDLVIRVPRGVTVEADARSGAGQVQLFGRQSDGLDVTRSSARDAGTGAYGTLHLDADVGLGRVVVVRDPAPLAALPKLGWGNTL